MTPIDSSLIFHGVKNFCPNPYEFCNWFLVAKKFFEFPNTRETIALEYFS